MLVALHELLLPPGPPAGMNLAMIGFWVVPLRGTPQPLSEPILVRRHECGQHWEIVDGRHRFVAGHVAGRSHIDAVEA